MNTLMLTWKCQGSLAGNVGRIGEEADAQMFIGIQMFKIITNA